MRVRPAHLHVIRREDNPRGVGQVRRQRAVPLDFLVVQAFDTYEFERMRVPQARSSDFALVNLSRGTVGAPMRPDGIGELLAALSRRAGLGTPVARISCGTPAAAMPPMPAPPLMWSLTCSDTRRSPPLRSTFILDPAGCGPRWTRCPALASATAAAGDRHGTGRDLRCCAPGRRGIRQFPHVLDGVVLDRAAARLAGMLDRALLGEARWDPGKRILFLPAHHRLLGRQVCRAERCTGTVHNDCPGVCYRCSPGCSGWG